MPGQWCCCSGKISEANFLLNIFITSRHFHSILAFPFYYTANQPPCILNNLVIFRLTSGNVYFRYLYRKIDNSKTLEVHMKQWISGIILSADDLQAEENAPFSNKEFTISMSMVCVALALFGIIVRVLGA